MFLEIKYINRLNLKIILFGFKVQPWNIWGENEELRYLANRSEGHRVIKMNKTD